MKDLEGWPWRPDLCPADLHYTEYLLGSKPLAVDPVNIIHVGTGLHHHVGLLLGRYNWRVVGFTISVEEHQAWLNFTNPPSIYHCLLQDIRDKGYGRIWGGLADSMSLFHLGETEPKSGQRDECEVIDLAFSWSREVVFYTGSYGYPHIAPIIDELLAAGTIHKRGEHKSLVAYGRTP